MSNRTFEAALKHEINEILIRHVDEHTAFTITSNVYNKVLQTIKENPPEFVKTKTVYRDTVSGKFVSKQYVEDNPATTIKSRIKNFLGM